MQKIDPTPLARKNNMPSLDDMIFELPGRQPDEPPVWVAAHTCPTPRCECRTGFLIASHESRASLQASVRDVHAAWRAAENYRDLAKQLEEVLVLDIDIDTAQVLSDAKTQTGGTAFDAALTERKEALAARLTGQQLDAIAQLWYHGKGFADPVQERLNVKSFSVPQWQEGKRLAWGDVFFGVRQDLYIVGDECYEAVEQYCPTPDCGCKEAIIGFEYRVNEKPCSVGYVIVPFSGDATLQAKTDAARALLAQLWAAYQQRYADHLGHLAERYRIMKTVGARIERQALPAVSNKVGRNEPCPCGSGKKHKKCCGGAN